MQKGQFWILFLLVFTCACQEIDDNLEEPQLEPSDQGVTFPTSPQENLDLPTPEANRAVIAGRLVTSDQSGKKPYIGTPYLADVIRSENPDAPPLIAFSQETAHQAQQTMDGRFIFTSVPAGEYALVLSTPVGQTILKYPHSEQQIIFKIGVGEILNLGEINIP